MAIEVKVNCSFAREIQAIKDVEYGLKKQLALEAAKIKIRTQSGRDVSGASFERYSKEYKRLKQRMGRNAKVDLVFSGAMQRAIETTTTREANGNLVGYIFFNSAGEAEKAQYNQRRREFFGLDQAQVDRIQKTINSLINI